MGFRYPPPPSLDGDSRPWTDVTPVTSPAGSTTRLTLLRGVGSPATAPSPRPLRLGELVRVRPGLMTPAYGWGALTPNSIGTILLIEGRGDCTVDFPEHASWHGNVADLEGVRSGSAPGGEDEELFAGTLVRVAATSPDSVWKGLGSGICVGQTCVVLERRDTLLHPYRVRSLDRNTVAHCTRACLTAGLPHALAAQGGSLVRVAWAAGDVALTPSRPHAPPITTAGQLLLGQLATVVDSSLERAPPPGARAAIQQAAADEAEDVALRRSEGFSSRRRPGGAPGGTDVASGGDGASGDILDPALNEGGSNGDGDVGGSNGDGGTNAGAPLEWCVSVTVVWQGEEHTA